MIGQADGTIKAYYNIGTDENPTFETGTFLMAGSEGQFNIDVGERATPFVVDWNNDGWTDIISGGLDGKIHIYINCQCNPDQPGFKTNPVEGTFAKENGVDLIVPQLCSSPIVGDFDGDGKKDIITGNSAGQLLFYKNVGTDASPTFSGYTIMNANGVKINLDKNNLNAAARSRPSIGNFNGDGFSDILVGSADGKVYLYQGLSNSEDLDGDGNVDNQDFVRLSERWRKSNCYYCGGADLNGSKSVDLQDLKILAGSWLSLRLKFNEFTFDTDPGWSRQGEWQFGQPLGQGGIDNPYADPNCGFTGTNVFGVNLSGDYVTTGGPYYLTTGPIDCSGHDNIKLKFARWLNMDESYYARATVEVSNNNIDWHLLWQHNYPPASMPPITDHKWQQMEYDLSNIVDNQPTVYVRWGYRIMSGAYSYSGWNIDDVQFWDYP